MRIRQLGSITEFYLGKQAKNESAQLISKKFAAPVTAREGRFCVDTYHRSGM